MNRSPISVFEHPPPHGGMDRRRFLKFLMGLGTLAATGPLLFGCDPSTPDARHARRSKNPERLTLGTAVDLYTLDPAIGFDTAIGSSLKSVYDTLFRYAGNPPRAMPWLVDRYAIEAEGTRWNFSLTPKAVFHDGTPLTAEAVKYSAQRLFSIGKGPADLFAGILDADGIRVVDSHRLQFHLKVPFGTLHQLLPWLFIVNPRLVKTHTGSDDGRTWLSDHDAGSGPFTLNEWKPGECYTFSPVPNYWKGWSAGRPSGGYVRRVIKDAGERIHALETGRVHLVEWAPVEAQNRLARKGFRVVDAPSMKLFEIKLNNRDGYTADRHVRRAISWAFDYKALKAIWAGRATLALGPLPANIDLGSAPVALYRLNLPRARAALARSPWPKGDFDLDFAYVRGLPEERRTGEIMKRQLAHLNIRVNLIPMAWADAVETFKDAETAPSMFPLYSQTAYPDPNNYLWSAYRSSRAGEWTNPGHYANPEVDALLAKARATLDQTDRYRIFRRVREIIVADAVNVFGVLTPPLVILSPRVTGFEYCPVMGSTVDYYRVRLSGNTARIAEGMTL